MSEVEKEKLRMVAEAAIRYSSVSESSHIPEADEDKCPGCQAMRAGLEILSALGDPNVYTA